MAKHLTPIVGLAVVMALALAAVFGSMSLARQPGCRRRLRRKRMPVADLTRELYSETSLRS